ncbi:DUF2251 domain-containing protein [Psychroserpens sp.]|uniref:DUF2251 domain-containing protein n=1 Tax=Psychroserpens sp. TaxID=2020870 RepID=UPI001B1BB983|nr:DUF2251 domain-containing protein [Psychroserpens sp.]MBO6606690.1 DUF2251 domain-containing protein [Psychroserpens sp.]MBO6631409.1 DUF2251 domain-containing protein [Psychroserpens sp.]MBO6653394.1 DUF2251 domain-containing protein [Psychroserpens sp.]MBO6680579.1 DUF2251 domain-containing protein [Psychroserpens sp.]MBO6750463.1 DUF2251 domain-containing protein [Psychroserpens sp.]
MKKSLLIIFTAILFSCHSPNKTSILGAELEFKPGENNSIESVSPKHSDYMLVFEDNGETGYLYVLAIDHAENPIVDAMHVYNVDSISDKTINSHYRIVWTQDGTKGALFINDYCHALVDFTEQGAYNRNGFPPAEKNGWVKKGHDWDESKLSLFKL